MFVFLNFIFLNLAKLIQRGHISRSIYLWAVQCVEGTIKKRKPKNTFSFPPIRIFLGFARGTNSIQQKILTFHVKMKKNNFFSPFLFLIVGIPEKEATNIEKVISDNFNFRSQIT